MNSFSIDALRAYSAPLLQPGARDDFAARAGKPADWASLYLSAVCNEAEAGLRLLEIAGVRPGIRLLEVGAGGGLLSGFLQSRGLEVVSIEPSANGFEVTPELTAVITAATTTPAAILPLAARELDRASHGAFDLIFSVNVIEHFQPLNENLDALARVMSRSGVQIHTCPNYRIPYEPHYAIPLLPFAPQYTPFMGNRRSEGLWRSLNFITASELQRYAGKWNLSLTLRPGALGEAFERLCAEPAFAARHPPAFSLLASLFTSIGITVALKRLPPAWVTPMTAILRRV
jgi:2-polyprenyl-3-methyl-5-hydroxy-6-metoxy-1,4-benzoquinol methylase